MGNAFFLVCDENPKVTERPANLHKTSKETRDQACQLITVLALCYQNKVFEPWKDFELRMVSHKIKQINAALRFTNVVLLCLIKAINSSSEQQKCIYLYRQNYTIINQNRQNHIPLNARSWNDLKRSLDGSLKK